MTEVVALLFVAFGLLAVLAGMFDWRIAVLAGVAMGFGQDVIRKAVEGEPVLLQMLFAPFIGAALVVVLLRYRLSLRPITGGDRGVTLAIEFFVLAVALQALHGLLRTGSPAVVGVGLMSYLAPLLATLVGYYYCRGIEDLRRQIVVYVACAAVVTTGIYLSFAGLEWDLLRQVGGEGGGLAIYDLRLGRIELHTGFLRAPEPAAWHAGAAACLVAVLGLSLKPRLAWLWVPLLALFLIQGGLYTGRRKMLVMVAVFAMLYVALLYLYRERRSLQTVVIVMLLSFATIIGSIALERGDEQFDVFALRGQSGFEDAWERFQKLGIGAIGWAYNRGGLTGLGVGTASQGAQHFVSENLAGGAGEGGLGKVMAELGAPGMAVALVLAVLLTRQLHRHLLLAGQHSAALLRLGTGVAAFLAANVPIFIGAAQIYGDPVVLCWLGLLLGFLFAIPRVLAFEQYRAAAAAVPAWRVGVQRPAAAA